MIQKLWKHKAAVALWALAALILLSIIRAGSWGKTYVAVKEVRNISSETDEVTLAFIQDKPLRECAGEQSRYASRVTAMHSVNVALMATYGTWFCPDGSRLVRPVYENIKIPVDKNGESLVRVVSFAGVATFRVTLSDGLATFTPIHASRNIVLPTYPVRLLPPRITAVIAPDDALNRVEEQVKGNALYSDQWQDILALPEKGLPDYELAPGNSSIFADTHWSPGLFFFTLCGKADGNELALSSEGYYSSLVRYRLNAPQETEHPPIGCDALDAAFRLPSKGNAFVLGYTHAAPTSLRTQTAALLGLPDGQISVVEY